ncbi:MAG: quinol:cytochrome C oxidoreductase, partial [Oligoflexia bacterium]|nr:quinol:cytochrome C oxidoreductase [Oligoflexia bacterium]
MKSLKISSGLSTAFSAAVFIGVACFSYAFLKDPNRAWHAYIMNYYFFACLGLGGLFFAATQHLTSAGWSATVRRIPEAFHAWFLPALILAIPIVVAGKTVYEWTHHEEVMNDHLLHMKSAYLNIPFFVVRLVLLFAVWYFIGGRLVKNSLKQDQTGDLTITHENVKFSAIYMPLFALLFTFFSVDLIMSMDPHWYSTMFGVNCFANLFLSTIAVTIIFVVHMKRAGYFGESINENHFHALGLLQFAFTVFYAYIAFCQFMLIWYGNMPEETVYYLKRYENGWSVVAYGVIFGKFLIPFLAQLPREA